MGDIIGDVLGNLAGKLIDKLDQRIDRASIADALREVADGVDRGDVVPDALLVKARALAESIADTRDRYRDG